MLKSINYSLIFLIQLLSIALQAQLLAPLFHLDASKGITRQNGNVTEWLDPISQVKAIQNTVLNQPEWIPSGFGNKPTIRFNGSSTYMNMPSLFPVNKDYTIAVVCKANGPSNNILGGTTHTLWMAGNTSTKILHNGDFNNQVSSSFDPGLEPVLILAHYNNKSQIGKLVLNGIYEDSSYCPGNSDNTIYLSAYQAGYYFNGDISEIQLYDRYLDHTERKKLETDLKQKYSIKDPPPPDTSFSQIPQDYQFYPRDSNDEATIQVAGITIQAGFDSIQLLLYRDQTLVSKTSQRLQFDTTRKANFLFSTKIKAELANYAIEIKLTQDAKDSLLARRVNLIAGDVYIVSGQSNSIFGGNPYTNSFIRTFGKNYSLNKSDTNWTIASAVGYGGGPDIGAWGMDLAKSIVENYKIPVCILNGGVGGTSIQQHQRDDIQPALPVNIYGSLLYRAKKSNLTNAVKAIFWYQGESNGSALYFENFKALHDDWKLDFPNVQKIYVVQIHHGCGAGDHAALREIQRRLPETFPNIELISTMGLPGHDGCHYTLDGYLRLAKTIFPLVQKDFYQGIDRAELYPPNILKAYFSKQDFSEISLEFSKEQASLVLSSDTLVNGTPIALKDYFALDDQWKQIKQLRVDGNKLKLELKIPGQVKTITYLPEVYYHDFNAVYQGPYLMNQNLLGALCFNKFPVDKEIPTFNTYVEKSKEPEVILFPNPGTVQTSLTITTNFKKDLKHVEILFRNLFGETVFSKTIDHISAGISHIEIDFSNQIPGTLIWQLKSENYLKTGRWLSY
ncbi:MAG: sialate O-acetylesterase [Saprospiraceae bacterium]